MPASVTPTPRSWVTAITAALRSLLSRPPVEPPPLSPDLLALLDEIGRGRVYQVTGTYQSFWQVSGGGTRNVTRCIGLLDEREMVWLDRFDDEWVGPVTSVGPQHRQFWRLTTDGAEALGWSWPDLRRPTAALEMAASWAEVAP